MKILAITLAGLWLVLVMAPSDADPTGMRSGAYAVPACDLYASPSPQQAPARGARPGNVRRHRPGSRANPFGGVQRLLNALRPGQTGCLEGGTYTGPIWFHHGGSSGHPITLRSVPGHQAVLAGGPVSIPAGSNDVTMAGLRIATAQSTQVGIQIMGDHAALVGNDITNGSAHQSCIILGNNSGWGQAQGTLIAGNTIHQCGNPADGTQDHAIYFDNSLGALVTDNVIWGTAAFAIHLYEHAVDNAVIHNVIYDNGDGVIFAGSSQLTSTGNVVAYNIIGDTTQGYDVSSWWGGAVGSGNVLESNCLDNAHRRTIERSAGGFSTSDNVTAAPGFVSAGTHDYQLQPHSQCLKVVGYDIVQVLRQLQRAALSTSRTSSS